MAVLARPQGGTIHNLRTEYSAVPKGMQIDLLYDSNLVGEKIGRGKREKKERRKRVTAGVAGEVQTRAPVFTNDGALTYWTTSP